MSKPKTCLNCGNPFFGDGDCCWICEAQQNDQDQDDRERED